MKKYSKTRIKWFKIWKFWVQTHTWRTLKKKLGVNTGTKGSLFKRKNFITIIISNVTPYTILPKFPCLIFINLIQLDANWTILCNRGNLGSLNIPLLLSFYIRLWVSNVFVDFATWEHTIKILVLTFRSGKKLPTSFVFSCKTFKTFQSLNPLECCSKSLIMIL